MTHIDIFTEEESARVALFSLLPKLLPEGNDYSVYSFQGKWDLISKLPNRLRAYRHTPLNTHKVIILLDRDASNCLDVKQRLEIIVREAGLVSKTVSPNSFQVVTRVVIEELESWYFGDINALHEAYPCVSKTLHQKRGFEDPDNITKPSKRLLHMLSAEYVGVERLPKIEVAERVTAHMNPFINRSKSFQAFYEGVRRCCEVERYRDT